MYLHLGQDTIVKKNDIVGIYDLDTSTVSKWTREYLSLCEKEGRVKNVSFELPKSFVVTKRQDEEKEMIYICPLAAKTLQKRAETDGLSADDGTLSI